MIFELDGVSPDLGQGVWIAATAAVIGRVTLGDHANIWFGAVLRGDVAPVRVGPRSNVQDGCVLHGEADTPTILGADCTLGHGAIVHGARLGDRVLVGMGAVVPEDSTIPAGVLVLGVPGRVVRPLTADERARTAAGAARYVDYMAAYKAAMSDER